MAKKQDLKIDDLVTIKPITDNQKLVFSEYKKGKNLFLHGAAGTGKTFVSLYLALQEVLDHLHLTKLYMLLEVQFLQERLVSYLAMKKIRQRCSKYHIRTWYSLCLSNHQTKRLVCYMID